MIETKEKRDTLSDFKKYVLDGLRMLYVITKNKNETYVIRTTQFGTIDIFPKSNKLFFRSTERWKHDGLNWLCNNL